MLNPDWQEFLNGLLLDFRLKAAQKRLDRMIADGFPKVLLVKQDIQDDLYCCSSNSSASQIVFSSLMRTGPVGLFTRMNADFRIVETEADLECQVWKQKVEELGWYNLEELEALKHSVPGRTYGQSEFAVRCDEIDFSSFDIVVSVDISIPSRITHKFPDVLWCYYVREPKASSSRKSLTAPIDGYDVFLTQRFGLKLSTTNSHSIDFPYYLQYPGCIEDLFRNSDSEPQALERDSCSIFLEHHTSGRLSASQLDRLNAFGPVRTTTQRTPHDTRVFDNGYAKSDLSTRERLQALLGSKYFVQFGKPGRMLFGNAAVEATCAGCLCLGDPAVHTHPQLFNSTTSIVDFNGLEECVMRLESDPELFQKSRARQQKLIELVCWTRPVTQLVSKWQEKISRRLSRPLKSPAGTKKGN